MMNNNLSIDYNLDNLTDILNQSIVSNRHVSIEYRKKDKLTKLKKPKKDNILKLKTRLESFENILSIDFTNFCVYKELIFTCENLKPYCIDFNNCTLEEGTEKAMLNFFNNCEKVNVKNKMDDRLFYALKNYFIKVKGKNLNLKFLEYNSIKKFFFGIHLNKLELRHIYTDRREMRKILKSLHRTKSLNEFIYEKEKAYGLIHDHEEVLEEQKLIVTYKARKLKGIFLNSLPPCIDKVAIITGYKKKYFQFLLTKYYKGANFMSERSFGSLSNQKDFDWLKFVINLR